ncbi:hypothetical protein SAY86_011487 [Trapa natans]|uniref:HMA domain-containing protein n=1 Tax=Trapa natans TaxID=22666 RepID=A0AAN7R0S5_TRANT|nr:hypothetical protein SAY86_011487 [Trapa natans]
MAPQKIVVKVRITCKRCKKDIMKAVSKLEGINNVSIDEEKELLTVVGEIDPVLIAEQLRKVKKFAGIVSVGPNKPPEPPKPQPPVCCTIPPVGCHPYPVCPVPVYCKDEYNPCSIL